MIEVRRSEDRGRADFGWLKATYSFSFGDYHDPRFQGFRDLLVMNEDRVQPDTGFGEHGHRDMEIVTYVIEGLLEHRDSTGTVGTLKYGDVQRMTAGRGVRHSEWNASKSDVLHLIQIWIVPNQKGLQPGYEEKHFDRASKLNRFCKLVGPQGDAGQLRIHQDASIEVAILEAGKSLEKVLAEGRHAWVQMIRGELNLSDVTLQAGDGAAISDQKLLHFVSKKESEFLLFDLR